MEWFRDHASAFSGTLLWNEPLSQHTYYRIGGPALVLAIPKNIEDLRWLARGIRETGVSYFLLGAGTNILISDAGWQGLVIKMTRLNLELTEHGEKVKSGASVLVSTLLRRASQEGWGGLEFLTGIPGSIGGVVVMNGGTHLGEARERIYSVSVFDLNSPIEDLHIFLEGELQFEYRKNLFLSSSMVVYSVEWNIHRQDPSQVRAQIDSLLQRRKLTQPIDFPSCGSVFKNPKTSQMHAWQVIDQLGLRGYRIGNAQFSEKHCNFILNLGGATAADVLGLITLAKTRAKAELRIDLEEEVKVIGQS